MIEQVDTGHDIFERLKGALPQHSLSVDENGVLNVRNAEGELCARNSLFRLCGQLWTGSNESESHLLALLGLDPVTKERRAGQRVLVHGEELGDRVVGVMGGYIRWAGLIEDATEAITVTEQLTGRKLDPFAREVILRVHELR